MLIVETIGRIRREHLIKGKSIKEIARDLKISRKPVRKVLRSGETSFSYEREIQPRPKLGRWKAELDRMLTANTSNPARDPALRGAAGTGDMRAAMTLFAAMPGPGAGSTRARWRTPTCR